MKDQPPFTGRKNTTSITAERAARVICKQPIDLSGRTSIAGYAIDSADPNTPMDRDDAIAIQYKSDPVHGNVTILHVTIADVAASIPKDSDREPNLLMSALDRDAQTNGETMYFTFGISPMLPESLQDRLSLEHKQERPGLTISVWLDKDANIVHTEFSRTAIRTHCKSYQDAGKDIAIHGHPLQQLSVVANHVLRKKSNVTDLPYYNPATGMYTDSEGNTRHINIDELSAYSMVQGCMIAANEGAAGIMRDSNFTFRNHSYTPRDMPDTSFFSKDALEQSGADTRKPTQNKAEYSPECHGHYGLNARIYSHVTSPIRRYADLVNQRMMHWAIDVADEVTSQFMKGNKQGTGEWDRERIAHHVWEHATQLLGEVTEYQQSSGNLQAIAGHNLEETLSDMAKAIPGIGSKMATEVARDALNALDAIKLPYTQKRLGVITGALNQTLERNRQTRRATGYSETEAWLNTVFPDTDAQKLLSWNAASFARLLEGAAKRGDINPAFAGEVLRRLETDKDTLVRNLHTLLVVSEGRQFGYWQILRRQAFQHLKDNPSLAEEVFSHMQEMQRRQSQPNGKETDTHEISTYILEATLLNEQNDRYPAALVVLSNDGVDYSASIIDKADTPEHARQGAILTFFRQYGNLHPHDTLYTPKLIDLALKRAKMRKGERFETLKQICEGYFAIDMQEDPLGHERDEKSVTLTLIVTNRETGEQVNKTRTGKREDVCDKAAKDILQDRRFHNMLTQCHHNNVIEDEQQGIDDLSNMFWAQSPHIIDRRQDDPPLR